MKDVVYGMTEVYCGEWMVTNIYLIHRETEEARGKMTPFTEVLRNSPSQWCHCYHLCTRWAIKHNWMKRFHSVSIVCGIHVNAYYFTVTSILVIFQGSPNRMNHTRRTNRASELGVMREKGTAWNSTNLHFSNRLEYALDVHEHPEFAPLDQLKHTHTHTEREREREREI